MAEYYAGSPWTEHKPANSSFQISGDISAGNSQRAREFYLGTFNKYSNVTQFTHTYTQSLNDMIIMSYLV